MAKSEKNQDKKEWQPEENNCLLRIQELNVEEIEAWRQKKKLKDEKMSYSDEDAGIFRTHHTTPYPNISYQ